jgi:hypothetical protein
MKKRNMLGRRRFLSVAAVTIAAAEFGGMNGLQAATGKQAVSGPRANDMGVAIFNDIKQIRAGVLGLPRHSIIPIM